MENIVRMWENETNPAGEVELTEAQLTAVYGAEDGWFPQPPQSPQFLQSPQAPQAPLFSQESNTLGEGAQVPFIKFFLSGLLTD